MAEDKCRVYECAIHYNPRSYEEGKKIGWKDGMRALYCILHYGACNAPVPMQLLLYLFIGGTAALANLISFAVCLSYQMPMFWAVIGSYVLSAAVNYLLCILILFRHKACWNTFGELAAYTVTLVIMGFLDYGITVGLIGIGCWMLAAKAIASILGFFGNYLLRKYFVFFLRRKP